MEKHLHISLPKEEVLEVLANLSLFFHYVSPTSTITKNGRPYALSAEGMKQIYNLYAMWWRKILCCDNLVEMEGLLSSNPLEGSPYGWKEAQGRVTPFKSANDKKLFK